MITLSYYEGLPHSRISEHLDIPLGTVKSRLREGVAKLRRLLLPGGPSLPLNRDRFTDISFHFAHTPFFVDFHGTLDDSGNGTAQLNTLGPLPSKYIGRTVHFAYLLYGPFDFVSNPVAITIVE